MNSTQHKMHKAINDFVNSAEFKSVLSTSITDKKGFYLLNPQVKIIVYLDYEGNFNIDAQSNGEGFAVYKLKISNK